MVSVEEVRQFIRTLPQTEESMHFRLPAFKVAGKSFIGIEKDNMSSIQFFRQLFSVLVNDFHIFV